MDATRRSPRDRFNTWFVDHEVFWELTMAALALIYVGVGFVVDEAPAGTRLDLELAELVLTAIFALEFTTRIVASHDRPAYVRGHWIDLVALIPPIRGARALRLLRLLRLIRALSGVYRALGHLGALARHQGFVWLVVAWLGVMAICSLWLYAAEHGINATVESPFDALWWGVSTLTTVGYGDVVPRTVEGRLAAMTLMLLGIGLFSTITATLASFLIAAHHTTARSSSGVTDELERLHGLRVAGAIDDEEYTAAKRSVLGNAL
jgi:voltage-gated potassium channel